jgi:hypothetical protein
LGWRVGALSFILLVGVLPVFSTAQSTPVAAAHGPILIEGDSDLCNPDDIVEGQDVADGITNCSTADGSAARPYIVSGWNVTWDPSGPCRIQPNPAVCPTISTCSTSTIPAAVAVCGTRKHILLERLEVGNAEISRTVDQGIPAAALLLSNVDHVAVVQTKARAGGIALYVEAGKPVPTLPPPTSAIQFDGLNVRSWTENAESALAGTVPDIAELGGFSIVRIADAAIVLRHVVLDASFRDLGLVANASTPTLFELTDSLVANGSSTAGLQLFDVDAVIERNVFRAIGIQGGASSQAQVSGHALSIQDGALKIRQNRFELEGNGIELAGAPTGDIRENVFVPPLTGLAVEALSQEVSGCTTARFSYNDLPGSTVHNGDTACPLDARYNWWDGEARATSDGSGAVATEPTLSRPIGQLPVVRIDAPSNGTQVHGKVFFIGTTQRPSDFSLERIEASSSESEWSQNRSSNSTGAWQLTWDVSGAPLGPTSVFVRACSAGDDCGLPTRVDLLVIERPLPPIALLEANPRVAHVGEPITLDASLSYSPQGRPLILFRFDLGDGRLSDWQSSPYFEARFSEPGQYSTSVQVQDAQDLINENLPQSVVRIQASTEDVSKPTPGIGTGAVFAVAAAALALVRRRA